MAWLKIDQNLPENPKTIHLRSLRRHKNTDETAGFLQRIWGWVLDAKPDGMIGEVSPRAVAEALKVRDGDELMAHLKEAGFVCTERCSAPPSAGQRADSEAMSGGRGLDPVAHRPGRIHDWDEMSGELARQRVREAERKRLIRAHERGEHSTARCEGCTKCERVSAGQRPDVSRKHPIDRDEPPGVPQWGRAMSAGRPPDKDRTPDPRPPDASRARAREGDKRERETRQDVPRTPGLTTGREATGSDVGDALDAMLATAEDRWRDVLFALLVDGVSKADMVTWFKGTRLEGDDAVVCPNGFARDCLARKYAGAVQRAMGRLVRFVLEGELVTAAVDDDPGVPE